ncbi:4-oxalomesaconate tautomerase [Oricola cellulosilytica]|uniref:4-oxalomesaconate tautomerase n=1 Tax=Oricola cellulosilytica TaxID=1429082 RepID=A0A4R0P8B3_9HYPH|nr:4-oxalomesaconate tautomerase [Oricola cellulosilytica]TCD13304.1 4-oxalomesaconate tautomerase [Oricola cellulosilytica]
MQAKIPCIFMRGGTSRGPYFNRKDLPEDLGELAKVLIAVVGAGHPLNIDGVGGGNAVTTKVAMLSKSDDESADVDYFFAQVAVEKEEVDFSPTCGNILSGVGPAAIEMGLVAATGDETSVRIRSTNTGALVEAKVQTPGGIVNYEGDAAINGVNGTAAPVILNFMNIVGSKTGAMFPTGNAIDLVDGFEVTCIDVAMPMVIGRSEDFGITGYESREELDVNRELFERFEPVRIKAGELMGFADVATSVVPKFGLLARPRRGGAIAARYFMPWTTHPSFAVTGSICTGSCLMAPGTVAAGLAQLPGGNPAVLEIEHTSGMIEVVMDASVESGQFDLKSAGLLRTARKLMSGHVYVPSSGLA